MSSPVTAEPAAAGPPLRPAWWVRIVSALPWPVLYAIASVAGVLAFRVFPYRSRVVQENLALAFPELSEAQLREIRRRYYRGFAEVLVEVFKSATIPADELRRRVSLRNAGLACAHLQQGSPVLLAAAHQCNWEWMLLALSLELGYPLDAAYKPLVNPWAEREMHAIRSRFGARLVPAGELLGDIIKRRAAVRAIAIVADQEPVVSERKHWTRFLNRDTAFFLGLEEIARVTKYPVLFLAMRRVARGCYEIEIQSLAEGHEALRPGELTERYARLAEAQIRASPPDWPWSHKRWRLKKPLYGAA